MFGLATICFNVSKRFAGPKFSKIRTTMFILLAGTAFIPIVHSIFSTSLGHTSAAFSLPYLLLESGMFLVGALLFMFQAPERWWPGRLDLWGNSHNIFHVLIVVASTVHFLGVLESMKFWKGRAGGGGSGDGGMCAGF
jgi:adiponectin receptor